MINGLPLPSTSMVDEKDLRRYLFRLVEQLNVTLTSINTVTGGVVLTNATNGEKQSTPVPANVKEEMNARAAELKALIIKNAKNVEAEFNEVINEFQSTYLAQSDFGTFEETIRSLVTESAEGMETLFETYSQIVDEYIAVTNGYIRQGIVRYDGITPIIGIAIGQDITTTGNHETVDGKDYEVIDTSHNMSIWTADKLAFYVNGAEVAYFANNALHVNMIVLKEWQLDESNGFTIRWVGGTV